MKHLIMLFVFAHAGYFLWRTSSTADRQAANKYAKKHLPFVLLTIVLGAVLIALAASTPSLKFL